MTFLISTVVLIVFVTATLPLDSVLYDRQSVDTDKEGVTWVLRGSEVSLRCRVNTSTCGQYHNVKGRFKNWIESLFYEFSKENFTKVCDKENDLRTSLLSQFFLDTVH